MSDSLHSKLLLLLFGAAGCVGLIGGAFVVAWVMANAAASHADETLAQSAKVNEQAIALSEQATALLGGLDLALGVFGVHSNGPAGTIIIDPQMLTIEYATDAIERITGRSTSKMQGEPVSVLLHPWLELRAAAVISERTGEAVELRASDGARLVDLEGAEVPVRAWLWTVQWNGEDKLAVIAIRPGDLLPADALPVGVPAIPF